VTYRIEKGHCVAAEGTLGTRIAPGRLVGAIFTFGLLRILKPLRTFYPEILDVALNGCTTTTAVLRLYDVKAASVLVGECLPHDGTCWVGQPSGDRCTGEYVREREATVTQTRSDRAIGGAAFGAGLPAAAGAVGFQARTNAEGRMVEEPNMNKAVVMLRCGNNVIDCALVVDSSAANGHGDCTDTKGRAYRLTLLPGPEAP